MAPMDWSQFDLDPGSFEKCSLLTAALTHLGLYILMFLGFVNQLIFKPKVATEKNREVNRKVKGDFYGEILCSAAGLQ